MKIAFTGATSLAGRVLCSRLRTAGHEVLVVSRRGGQGAVAADLADPALAAKLPDERFDALIHFAATVPLNEGTSTWEECAPATVYGSIELMKWADGRVGKVLLASSCALYGRHKLYTPTDEAHPLRPDTAYALSKYAQEQLVTAFCRSRVLPLVVMRLGYVYGPGMDSSRAVVKLLKNVAAGNPINLTNAVTEGLHLIHVDDIAAIGEVLLQAGYGTYNVTPDRHISLREYVATASSVLGRTPEVIEKNDPEARVNNFYTAGRLRRLHGVTPAVSLVRGIESLIGEFIHG